MLRPGRPAGALLLLLPLPLLPWLPGGHAGNLTVAVVLPLANTSYPWSWARVGPAVELALAGVRARPDLLPGWTVRTVLGSSEDARGVCSDTAAPLAAVDLKWEHSPAVFLGPGCVYAAAPVGRFTAHWRVPLLTAGAPALGFGAKDEYALTTRAGPSHAKLGDLVAALHRRLGWERRALVLYAYRPGDDQPCFFVVEGLYMRVRDRLNITVDHLEFAEGDLDHYALLLRTVRRRGRGEGRGAGRSSPAPPQPGPEAPLLPLPPPALATVPRAHAPPPARRSLPASRKCWRPPDLRGSPASCPALLCCSGSGRPPSLSPPSSPPHSLCASSPLPAPFQPAAPPLPPGFTRLPHLRLRFAGSPGLGSFPHARPRLLPALSTFLRPRPGLAWSRRTSFPEFLLPAPRPEPGFSF